jgi:hypothetical protein
MDWAKPELLASNPFWIVNNQQTIVVNFHRDFIASMHSGIFQGQTTVGHIYCPNHSMETQLSMQ